MHVATDVFLHFFFFFGGQIYQYLQPQHDAKPLASFSVCATIRVSHTVVLHVYM